MQPIYILTVFLLLYIFFGPIVDYFTLKDDSNQVLRIKIKIFLTSFGVPIILGTFILFVFLTENKSYNIWSAVVFVIIILARAFFGKRKYITYFKIGSTQLELTYLTSLIKEKSYSIDLNEITDFETTKANLLLDEPAQINIKSKDGWQEFHMIDKRLKASIQGDIDVAVQRFAVSGT